ncbi:hypothetical protein MANY_01620 [Mycolicibacterium anyangense]|uniref:Uncharacterized protein n=1 Tax=Mycolicibacterium anyangense TaxID=1431246 RepID=A0A6N4W2E0_9MYCO|nr:hypothetical protein MANY_01620 [Mycolicibacterium anyangense]
MIENTVELVDAVRPKCIADLGSIESHPNRRLGYTVKHMTVIGDVGQVAEAFDRSPE